MEDKQAILRMLLAIVISVLVLVAYEHLFLRPKGVPTPEPREAPRAEVQAPVVEEPAKAPSAQGEFEEVVVETPLYRAVFSSYGGRLKAFALKGYRDKVELHPLGKWVQGLIGKVFGKKPDLSPPKPVDLVTTEEPEKLPLALAVKGFPYNEEIPWRASAGHLEVKEGPAELTLLWKDGDRWIERTYRFFPDRYEVETEIRLSEPAPLALGWMGRTDLRKSYYGFYGPILYGPEGREKVKPKKVKGVMQFDQVEWFAFDQDYFASIIAPEGMGKVALGRFDGGVIYGFVAPGEVKAEYRYKLFLGPKDPDLLGGFLPSAKKVIDYGTFGWIAVPILKVMEFTHTFTGNWGLDIILLALIIKLIFLWPTHKSYEAMREMQKLAPEIKMLQKKYKDDKERLQKELMELYRRRRINPFSGCLPLLLQLPVFFALYRALLVSIDLRHAPFVLWIRDLSDKDPTYISPLLMGATMFLQQKLTPAQGDPQQQKMMLFLPLIFTVLFLNFPSGLVLYWLSSNIFGILHQLYLTRRR